MMEQLILHGIGDYITQTNFMANNKTKYMFIAFIHALIYTFPFILLTQSSIALLTILFTHAIIDHYRLARYVVFAKNWINEPHLTWEDCQATGYPSTVPPFLSVWLLIIADNVMHVSINYAAIRWL